MENREGELEGRRVPLERTPIYSVFVRLNVRSPRHHPPATLPRHPPQAGGWWRSQGVSEAGRLSTSRDRPGHPARGSPPGGGRGLSMRSGARIPRRYARPSESRAYRVGGPPCDLGSGPGSGRTPGGSVRAGYPTGRGRARGRGPGGPEGSGAGPLPGRKRPRGLASPRNLEKNVHPPGCCTLGRGLGSSSSELVNVRVRIRRSFPPEPYKRRRPGSFRTRARSCL